MLTWRGGDSRGGLATMAVGTRDGDSSGSVGNDNSHGPLKWDLIYSVDKGRWSRRRRPLQLNGGDTARAEAQRQRGWASRTDDGEMRLLHGRAVQGPNAVPSAVKRTGKGAAMADFSAMGDLRVGDGGLREEIEEVGSEWGLRDEANLHDLVFAVTEGFCGGKIRR
ncbi:hypothetical protein PIB30_082700 [Stylosanthes scabra]|uniref:Uncharacterized protein n=1 Tax=Stylosanthes scabra TaxID=79078 RepID=A0ABU6ZQT4_9FABA|nr:hypothetical protein [Stylosanthes scabra]